MSVAAELLETAVRDEQAVRRIPDDEEAEAVRAAVRRLARARDIRVRTARMDDTVAVVLADAAIWHEDAATMRRKLTPAD